MRILACMLALLLSACAQTPAARTSMDAPPAPASAAATLPVPASTSTAFATGVVNRACKADADCAVKDTGNCCLGAYPQCVNKDAGIDQAKIRAQCGMDHRMRMCMLRRITGCTCVQGVCNDINATEPPKTN